MTNSWLRLWHDMPNDPKWRTIARVSGTTIPEVISVYLHILVEASNATERGRTQPNIEDIASALDMTFERVQSVVDAMQGRVIEGDKLTGWEKRQPQREDNSADRAKKWREEQKRTQANATERKRTLEKSREEKSREELNTNTLALTSEEVHAVRFSIPLNDGSFRDLIDPDLERFSELYPAVDVGQSIRNLIGWCEGNRKHLKTPDGVMRFIHSWLKKDQNGATVPKGAGNVRKSITQQNLEDLADIARRLDEADGRGDGLVSESEGGPPNANALPEGVAGDRGPTLLRAV